MFDIQCLVAKQCIKTSGIVSFNGVKESLLKLNSVNFFYEQNEMKISMKL